MTITVRLTRARTVLAAGVLLALASAGVAARASTPAAVTLKCNMTLTVDALGVSGQSFSAKKNDSRPGSSAISIHWIEEGESRTRSGTGTYKLEGTCGGDR